MRMKQQMSRILAGNMFLSMTVCGFLEQEIINARAGEASLSQLLRAHEAILKEVTDCHSDSSGILYENLSDRLKLLDAMAAPRLPVSSYFAPRDNTNGELKTGAMGVSAVGENVQFKF